MTKKRKKEKKRKPRLLESILGRISDPEVWKKEIELKLTGMKTGKKNRKVAQGTKKGRH